jgi:hypothetical protein
MQRLLIAAVAVLIAVPAVAQVDPKVHKLCIEAKDYAGCVKTMTQGVKGEQDSTSTVRIVEGERELTGNSCPENMAYAGAGWCSDIDCVSRSSGLHLA